MRARPVQMRRILVLTSSFPRWEGDTEGWFVFELSRRLARDCEVFVVAPHAPGARAAERLGGVAVRRYRYAPAPLERLAYSGGLLSNVRRAPWLLLLVPLFLCAMLVAACSVLVRARIAVVHAHWIFPQGFVALLAKRLMFWRELKVVCTAHGGDVFGLRGGFWRHVQRWVLRGSDEVAVVSAWLREVAENRSGREGFRVMPMGVDTRERFRPLPGVERRPGRLLFVGRLVEKKGARYLLAAMPAIVARFPDAELLVAGDGPEREALERQAAELGVSERVSFLGTVSQAALPELYCGSAVFVGPSVVAVGGDQEGLGLVFAEACACECAVVASSLPAIRDVIADGKTGVLVEPRDSLALGDAVVALLEKPALARELGAAGRRHAQSNFDWNTVAAGYSKLLLE